jgi:hypothetical protein
MLAITAAESSLELPDWYAKAYFFCMYRNLRLSTFLYAGLNVPVKIRIIICEITADAAFPPAATAAPASILGYTVPTAYPMRLLREVREIFGAAKTDYSL